MIDKVIVFDKYVIDEDKMKNWTTVFVSEKYLLEIISGLKLLNDQSILSFKRMFDYQVYKKHIIDNPDTFIDFYRLGYL